MPIDKAVHAAGVKTRGNRAFESLSSSATCSSHHGGITVGEGGHSDDEDMACADGHFASIDARISDIEGRHLQDIVSISELRPKSATLATTRNCHVASSHFSVPFAAVDQYLEREGVKTGRGVRLHASACSAPLFRMEHRSSDNVDRAEFFPRITAELGKRVHTPAAKRMRATSTLKPTTFCSVFPTPNPLIGGLVCERQKAQDSSLRNVCPEVSQTTSSSSSSSSSSSLQQVPALATESRGRRPHLLPPPRPDMVLSEEQELAVGAPLDALVLVLAGPGSGKTRFLTARLVRALKVARDSRQGGVVAVTYTRRAACELSSRVKQFHGGCDLRYGLWVGTVHGLALRLLRGTNGGCPFRVASDHELREIISGPLGGLQELSRMQTLPQLSAKNDSSDDCSEDIDVDSHHRGPRGRDRIGAMLDLLRNIRRRPDCWAASPEAQSSLASALARFEQELRRRGLLEITDVLPQAIALLRGSAPAQRWASIHVRQLFVDEWQDTDTEQGAFLRLLAGSGMQAVIAVGDDDQQIYAWRFRGHEGGPAGAFRDLWPSAVVMTLGANFRSARAIVSAAARLISCNARREVKELHSARPDLKGEVACSVQQSELDEAVWVGHEILRLSGNCSNTNTSSVVPGASWRIDDSGGSSSGIARAALPPHSSSETRKPGCLATPSRKPWSCFAVLARTRVMAARLVAQLAKLGVPVKSIHSSEVNAKSQGGGSRHGFTASELDLIAYLRLAIDEHDDDALQRILNTPKGGLGKAALRCLRKRFHGPRDFGATKASPLDNVRKLDPVVVGAAAAAGRKEVPGGSYAGAIRRFASSPCGVPHRMAQGFASLDHVLRTIQQSAKDANGAAQVPPVLRNSCAMALVAL